MVLYNATPRYAVTGRQIKKPVGAKIAGNNQNQIPPIFQGDHIPMFKPACFVAASFIVMAMMVGPLYALPVKTADVYKPELVKKGKKKKAQKAKINMDVLKKGY